MDDKNLNTLQQYVGDMVALESHIEQSIDGQVKEVKEHPQAAALVQGFHEMVRSHRDTLKAHLEKIGGSESHPVKDAIADLFGMAAGAINMMRTKAPSKSLRDDYTAFNHAIIGYAMLHTTATVAGNHETAALAERFMQDYARAVKQIEPVIGSIVVEELVEEGVGSAGATSTTGDVLARIWQQAATSTGGSSSTFRAA